MAIPGDGLLKLGPLDHVGIRVKNCEAVMETWAKMYSIGPWAIREMKGKTPEGEDYTVRLAFAYSDNGVELELVQLPEGRDTFIEEHGEGLRHWGFFVDDVDGEAKKMVDAGAKIVAQQPGGWVYLEVEGAGGVIFELMQRRERIT